ncbi:MAG: hypothetical protein MJZ74_06175 [Muribaculaceae bacterium]|nr:hypothetical protein [Muribaculaceae bacterium]
MKKILCLLAAAVMCASAAFAQENVMKFMGIPMGQTVYKFQAQLVARGMEINNTGNTNSCSRWLNGTFSGEKALIIVYFDANTKKVYRAKAVIARDDRADAKNLKSEFQDMLSIKYKDAKKVEGSHDGYSSTRFEVSELGKIDLYMNDTDRAHNVMLDYWDQTYYEQHLNSRMVDL